MINRMIRIAFIIRDDPINRSKIFQIDCYNQSLKSGLERFRIDRFGPLGPPTHTDPGESNGGWFF